MGYEETYAMRRIDKENEESLKKRLGNLGISNVSTSDGLRGNIAGLAQILSATESLDEPTEAPMDSKGNIKRKIAPLESGQKTVAEVMAVAKESKRV